MGEKTSLFDEGLILMFDTRQGFRWAKPWDFNGHKSEGPREGVDPVFSRLLAPWILDL